MTGPRPEFLLRHGTSRDPDATGPCPDDDTIAALAEGTLEGPTRAASLAHVGQCARCRRMVASVAGALADPAVTREIATLGSGFRRVPTLALGALAAAILLLVAIPRTPDDAPRPHRASDITAVAAPVLVSPVGIVPAAERLRWATVGGADRYRAALFDETGATVYEIVTSDTVVTLPDTVSLTPGRTYLWKVDARTGWGRWAASQLTEFSIR